MRYLIKTKYVALIRWPESSVWGASLWRYGVYLELGRFTLNAGFEKRSPFVRGEDQ